MKTGWDPILEAVKHCKTCSATVMKENEQRTQPDFYHIFGFAFESNIFTSKETVRRCQAIALVSRDEKGDRTFG